MDKKTYWKDGYQLIDNSGLVYTVKGKCASCRKLGKNPDGSIEEEEYDDDLKLIHRWGRGDKYDEFHRELDNATLDAMHEVADKMKDLQFPNSHKECEREDL